MEAAASFRIAVRMIRTINRVERRRARFSIKRFGRKRRTLLRTIRGCGCGCFAGTVTAAGDAARREMKSLLSFSQSPPSLKRR